MGGQAISYELGGAILAAILFVCLYGYMRARRIRRWNSALEQRRRPAKMKQLPKDLEVHADETLFDALYRHFGTRPEGLVPSALGVAIAGPKGGVDAKSIPGKSSPVSDEERIKSLLSAPTDASVAPPSDAFTQNLVLNLVNVFRGKKKLKQGLEHAVLDSLAPGGGFAGAKIGGAVGLALAPLVVGMATVFIPVTVAAGAWLGAWTGKQVGTRFKARHYFAVLKRLRIVSRDFQRWFVQRFPEFLRDLDREYEAAFQAERARLRENQGRFTRLFFPDLLTVFHRRSLVRLRADRAADRRHFKQVFATIRSQDPLEFAAVLERMNARTLEAHPEFTDYRRNYRAALRDFRELQKGAA